jgi:hypothetical protein
MMTLLVIAIQMEKLHVMEEECALVSILTHAGKKKDF